MHHHYETVDPKNFANRVKLAGVSLTPKAVNGSIESVELRDQAGNCVVFQTRDYSFQVLVPVKPKIKVWRVTGSHETLGDYAREFTKDSDAVKAKSTLEQSEYSNVEWNHIEVEDTTAAEVTQ